MTGCLRRRHISEPHRCWVLPRGTVSSAEHFSQEDPGGHQAHGKMLYTADCQRNASQRYSEQPSSQSLRITDAGRSMKKREPPYTVGGNVNWCVHYGEQNGQSLKKLEIRLLSWSRGWLRIHLPMQETWVQYLVGELSQIVQLPTPPKQTKKSDDKWDISK